MFNVKAIAEILVRLPLGDAKAAERAGAPFEMPYTTVLPPDDVDCWRLYRDLLETSQDLSDDLLSRGPSVEGRDYIISIRDLDLGAIAWLDQMLAGQGRRRLVGV